MGGWVGGTSIYTCDHGFNTNRIGELFFRGNDGHQGSFSEVSVSDFTPSRRSYPPHFAHGGGGEGVLQVETFLVASVL